MKYKVHRFDMKMTTDQSKLEYFLNHLEGEVVTILPNVIFAPVTRVDFVLVVERLNESRSDLKQTPLLASA